MTQERIETRWIEIDFTPAEMEEMNAYMEVCGFDNRVDLFNNALTLMMWVTENRKAGHRVVSFDRETGKIESEAPTFEELRAGWKPEKADTVRLPYRLDVQDSGAWRWWAALQRFFRWRQ